MGDNLKSMLVMEHRNFFWSGVSKRISYFGKFPGFLKNGARSSELGARSGARARIFFKKKN